MARGPSPRELKAAWQKRLKHARSLYAEKVAIRKEALAERRGRVWPINLAPDPDGTFALRLALQEESAARTEYMRILRIFNGLMREGTLPEEGPGLFLVGRETGTNLYRPTAMGDEEDQETPLEEMDGHQLAEKTAWVRLFLRQASKRGYTIDDIVALLDEPGTTVEAGSSGFCLPKTKVAPTEPYRNESSPYHPRKMRAAKKQGALERFLGRPANVAMVAL